MANGTANGSSSACAKSHKVVLLTTKYSKGVVVYSRPDAIKGIIEAVAIKSIQFVNDSYIYVDTYNAHWSEDMLILRSDAISLATIYFQNVQEGIITEIETC